MRKKQVVFLLSSFLFISCSTGRLSATPQIVTVYSTFAAGPWLFLFYECAGTSTVIFRGDDPSTAQIVLRVGEPQDGIKDLLTRMQK